MSKKQMIFNKGKKKKSSAWMHENILRLQQIKNYDSLLAPRTILL